MSHETPLFDEPNSSSTRSNTNNPFGIEALADNHFDAVGDNPFETDSAGNNPFGSDNDSPNNLGKESTNPFGDEEESEEFDETNPFS